jgi:hypothetical protein
MDLSDLPGNWGHSVPCDKRVAKNSNSEHAVLYRAPGLLVCLAEDLGGFFFCGEESTPSEQLTS